MSIWEVKLAWVEVIGLSMFVGSGRGKCREEPQTLLPDHLDSLPSLQSWNAKTWSGWLRDYRSSSPLTWTTTSTLYAYVASPLLNKKKAVYPDQPGAIYLCTTLMVLANKQNVRFWDPRQQRWCLASRLHIPHRVGQPVFCNGSQLQVIPRR